MDILIGELAIPIIQALQSLNDFLPDYIDLFFLIITQLGSVRIYIVFLVIIYLINKKTGARLIFLLIITSYLTYLVKGIFGNLRPYEVSAEIRNITEEPSYSFFSAHSSATGAFWGYLALYTKNKRVVGLGIVLTILILLSRVYLAVHWPSDVVVGVIVGLLLAYLVYRYGNAIEERLKLMSDVQLLLMGVLISLVLAIISVLVPIMAGTDLLRSANTEMPGALAGFAIGLILERRTSNFSNLDLKSSDWKVKFVLRMMIGLIIVIGTYLVLSFLFGSFEGTEFQLITDYVRYLLMAFTGAFICPYLFVKLKI
ncbi:MAG: phosphatase PAP2 family protein [Candidatus Odinarchaeota archaeon]